MGPGHGWRGAAAPVLRAGCQAPRRGAPLRTLAPNEVNLKTSAARNSCSSSTWLSPLQEDGTEEGLLRAVSSHAKAARMAGMPRGGLRRPSTCKTWRQRLPASAKPMGMSAKAESERTFAPPLGSPRLGVPTVGRGSTPPRGRQPRYRGGAPRTGAVRTFAPPLGSPRLECRRWAAGLRHQEFVEFLGVLGAEVPAGHRGSSRKPHVERKTATEHSGAVAQSAPSGYTRKTRLTEFTLVQ